MRDTKYATTLKSAVVPFTGDSEARIELLYVKELAQQEVRLSWWKEGRFIPRPLDLSEEALVNLIAAGMKNGILSHGFADDVRRAVEKS